MQDTTKYPRFIPDKPVGKDCFEGHSQERLAHSVCDYVRRIDAKTAMEGQAENTMPRIIGLEGGWGTGKSNVVRMVEDELAKEGYYTFTYDAWGHQEDLQRRSILETMTSHLIDKQILQGKVKIPMRSGKVNEDTWKNQLSLLLSNKTTTIRKSIPKLAGAAVWGICLVASFAVLTVISGVLLNEVDGFPFWVAVLMDLLPVILGLGLSIFYRCKDGNWDRTLKLISQREDDTIDEEYTSSEEPSVAEFKNWMRAMSDYLGSTKQKFNKLIIVFDNMDRLPSEKVMQLWSSIYTFFAGGEFKNIWTVIPYDYKHLCQAIYGSEESGDVKKEDMERIKKFISKTFPITYHVPEPVITDYKKLFYTYFDAAFGADEHDREHICQVFIHLNPQPNPRTVIRFVNELVALRMQWSDTAKYRLQNLALYALKKDYIHYEGDSEDVQLLSEGLFDKIRAFYPKQKKVRIELCQYAYGLDDEKLAGELPLRNELKRLIEAGGALGEYAGQDNLLTVLEDVLNDVDVATVDNAVRSLASLDGVKLAEDMKEHIRKKWDMLANIKVTSRYDKHQFDEILTILINHATEKRVNELAKAYAKAMQGVVVTDGAAYFKAQDKLRQELKAAKVKFDDKEWYKIVTCNAEQFVQYVCEAEEAYQHYGLTCETKELNEYLTNGAMSGNEKVATVVDYIKNDEEYDLSELIDGLSETIAADGIKDNITIAAYVHRVLDKGEDVLKVRFSKETVAGYLNTKPAPWAEKLPVGLEDVMAMSLADGKDLSAIDDKMLPRICGCMDRYFEYTDLLKHTGKEGSAYRKLNIYCVEHLAGNKLDTKYAALHMAELQKALGLEQEQLLKQFNRWSAIEWGEMNAENEYVKGVKNYVHQSFFSSYRDNPGNFSDSVIMLGVGAIECQKNGFLAGARQVQQNYSIVTKLVVDGYWKAFVETFLGTEYMPQAVALLTNEAVTMLQWLYDHNEVTDAGLLEIVLKHADEGTLRSYLHSMMNDHLSKTNSTKAKFLWFGKLLPLLGADMDQNTARGLMTHFIKPIGKEAECTAVIVSHKDFYLTILRKDTSIAEPIVKEMVAMDGFAEIADELKTIVA
ncbi:MAG: hypothetical protein II844_10835 [Prevotella sp.]|nr:hypothetical protein [Prevotella sp.]